MRPAAMEMLEKPLPTLLLMLTVPELHNSFGPSVGHSWSKPVSVEMALRSGPRHSGQSRDGTSFAGRNGAEVPPPIASGTKTTVKQKVNRVSMICTPQRTAGKWAGVAKGGFRGRRGK